jgi:hypothetical protein
VVFVNEQPLGGSMTLTTRFNSGFAQYGWRANYRNFTHSS